MITALSFASFRFFLVEQSASTLYGFLILMLYLCSIKRADKNGQNFKVCSYIAASEISLHWKLQKIFSYDMLTQHMWCWFYEILFCMQGNDFTTTGWAPAYILIIKKVDNCRCIHILQSRNIFFTAKDVSAQGNLFLLVSGWKKSVVPDTYKTFWRNMH